MGGGHSHLVHPDHLLRRATCGSVGACGLCGGRVNLGEVAYRCTTAECTSFFLHDACYRYPERIKNHFSGHSLALTAVADVTPGGCTVCARALHGLSYVYSCRQSRHLGCGGFRAHPRCGNLPRQASAASHGGHQLVLRPPGGGGAGRRCVECNKASGGGQARAWSYQCVTCQDRELCLTCVFGRDGALHCCCCNQCPCGAGCFVGCAGPAGLAMGHFLHSLPGIHWTHCQVCHGYCKAPGLITPSLTLSSCVAMLHS